eukprot:TRINITY_DN9334_c0_g3_i1.p1 TRINITY_DN9334_c0_g3~~TRINITY_DN9334_c0_g3_i1.p1  ORF type:complete len:521 (+),score=142.52 TRINITY_DN9334_c0_g3_i1:49-1611(+)
MATSAAAAARAVPAIAPEAELNHAADVFGDPTQPAEGGASIACAMARDCLEDSCRWISANITAVTSSKENASVVHHAITCLFDISAGFFLAGAEFKYLLVRILMRKVLRAFRNEWQQEEVKDMRMTWLTAMELYTTLSHSSPRDYRNTVDGLSPVLSFFFARSLVHIAERYLAKHERHFLFCVNEAVSLLRKITDAKDGEPRFLVEELLGRAHLQRARHSIYNETTERAVAEAQLGLARDALMTALRLSPDSKRLKTASYDMARVCALKGKEVLDAHKYLEQAGAADALPSPRDRLFVEPDFASVRNTPWFRAVCGVAATGPIPLYDANADYNLLKSSLMGGGFTVQKVVDYLPHLGNPLRILDGQATTARQRMKERLAMFGLRERRDIPGDGNCQFYSLSDQLFDAISHAPEVRHAAVDWLEAHCEWDVGNGARLRDFVCDQPWEAYCKQMSRSGVWGDNLTLTAVSEVFNVRICVVSSVAGDNFITEVVPMRLQNTPNVRVLLLCHFAEYHYGSLAYV